jgi:hypothetical protein
MAVDETGHEIFFTDTIWQHYADRLGGAFTSVSCPTTQFCLAVDATGREVTFSQVGTKLEWSGPKQIDSVALRSVACRSARFCIAVDDMGRYLAFSGGAWHAPVNGVPAASPNSISCTNSVCVEVGGTRAVIASIT